MRRSSYTTSQQQHQHHPDSFPYSSSRGLPGQTGGMKNNNSEFRHHHHHHHRNNNDWRPSPSSFSGERTGMQKASSSCRRNRPQEHQQQQQQQQQQPGFFHQHQHQQGKNEVPVNSSRSGTESYRRQRENLFRPLQRTNNNNGSNTTCSEFYPRPQHRPVDLLLPLPPPPQHHQQQQQHQQHHLDIHRGDSVPRKDTAEIRLVSASSPGTEDHPNVPFQEVMGTVIRNRPKGGSIPLNKRPLRCSIHMDDFDDDNHHHHAAITRAESSTVNNNNRSPLPHPSVLPLQPHHFIYPHDTTTEEQEHHHHHHHHQAVVQVREISTDDTVPEPSPLLLVPEEEESPHRHRKRDQTEPAQYDDQSQHQDHNWHSSEPAVVVAEPKQNVLPVAGGVAFSSSGEHGHPSLFLNPPADHHHHPRLASEQRGPSSGNPPIILCPKSQSNEDNTITSQHHLTGNGADQEEKDMEEILSHQTTPPPDTACCTLPFILGITATTTTATVPPTNQKQQESMGADSDDRFSFGPCSPNPVCPPTSRGDTNTGQRNTEQTQCSANSDRGEPGEAQDGHHDEERQREKTRCLATTTSDDKNSDRGEPGEAQDGHHDEERQREETRCLATTTSDDNSNTTTGEEETVVGCGYERCKYAGLPKGERALLQVGTRVAVYWGGEGLYFEGAIRKERPHKNKRFFIEYEDGDHEWTSFRKTTFFIIDGRRTDNNNHQDLPFSHRDWVNDDDWVLGAVPVVPKKKDDATTTAAAIMEEDDNDNKQSLAEPFSFSQASSSPSSNTGDRQQRVKNGFLSVSDDLPPGQDLAIPDATKNPSASSGLLDSASKTTAKRKNKKKQMLFASEEVGLLDSSFSEIILQGSSLPPPQTEEVEQEQHNNTAAAGDDDVTANNNNTVLLQGEECNTCPKSPGRRKKKQKEEGILDLSTLPENLLQELLADGCFIPISETVKLGRRRRCPLPPLEASPPPPPPVKKRNMDNSEHNSSKKKQRIQKPCSERMQVEEEEEKPTQSTTTQVVVEKIEKKQTFLKVAAAGVEEQAEAVRAHKKEHTQTTFQELQLCTESKILAAAAMEPGEKKAESSTEDVQVAITTTNQVDDGNKANIIAADNAKVVVRKQRSKKFEFQVKQDRIPVVSVVGVVETSNSNVSSPPTKSKVKETETTTAVVVTDPESLARERRLAEIIARQDARRRRFAEEQQRARKEESGHVVVIAAEHKKAVKSKKHYSLNRHGPNVETTTLSDPDFSLLSKKEEKTKTIAPILAKKQSAVLGLDEDEESEQCVAKSSPERVAMSAYNEPEDAVVPTSKVDFLTTAGNAKESVDVPISKADFLAKKEKAKKISGAILSKEEAARLRLAESAKLEEEEKRQEVLSTSSSAAKSECATASASDWPEVGAVIPKPSFLSKEEKAKKIAATLSKKKAKTLRSLAEEQEEQPHHFVAIPSDSQSEPALTSAIDRPEGGESSFEPNFLTKEEKAKKIAAILAKREARRLRLSEAAKLEEMEKWQTILSKSSSAAKSERATMSASVTPEVGSAIPESDFPATLAKSGKIAASMSKKKAKRLRLVVEEEEEEHSQDAVAIPSVSQTIPAVKSASSRPEGGAPSSEPNFLSKEEKARKIAAILAKREAKRLRLAEAAKLEEEEKWQKVLSSATTSERAAASTSLRPDVGTVIPEPDSLTKEGKAETIVASISKKKAKKLRLLAEEEEEQSQGFVAIPFVAQTKPVATSAGDRSEGGVPSSEPNFLTKEEKARKIAAMLAKREAKKLRLAEAAKLEEEEKWQMVLSTSSCSAKSDRVTTGVSVRPAGGSAIPESDFPTTVEKAEKVAATKAKKKAKRLRLAVEEEEGQSQDFEAIPPVSQTELAATSASDRSEGGAPSSKTSFLTKEEKAKKIAAILSKREAQRLRMTETAKLEEEEKWQMVLSTSSSSAKSERATTGASVRPAEGSDIAESNFRTKEAKAEKVAATKAKKKAKRLRLLVEEEEEQSQDCEEIPIVSQTELDLTSASDNPERGVPSSEPNVLTMEEKSKKIVAILAKREANSFQLTEAAKLEEEEKWQKVLPSATTPERTATSTSIRPGVDTLILEPDSLTKVEKAEMIVARISKKKVKKLRMLVEEEEEQSQDFEVSQTEPAGMSASNMPEGSLEHNYLTNEEKAKKIAAMLAKREAKKLRLAQTVITEPVFLTKEEKAEQTMAKIKTKRLPLLSEEEEGHSQDFVQLTSSVSQTELGLTSTSDSPEGGVPSSEPSFLRKEEKSRKIARILAKREAERRRLAEAARLDEEEKWKRVVAQASVVKSERLRMGSSDMPKDDTSFRKPDYLTNEANAQKIAASTTKKQAMRLRLVVEDDEELEEFVGKSSVPKSEFAVTSLPTPALDFPSKEERSNIIAVASKKEIGRQEMAEASAKHDRMQTGMLKSDVSEEGISTSKPEFLTKEVTEKQVAAIVAKKEGERQRLTDDVASQGKASKSLLKFGVQQEISRISEANSLVCEDNDLTTKRIGTKKEAKIQQLVEGVAREEKEWRKIIAKPETLEVLGASTSELDSFALAENMNAPPTKLDISSMEKMTEKTPSPTDGKKEEKESDARSTFKAPSLTVAFKKRRVIMESEDEDDFPAASSTKVERESVFVLPGKRKLTALDQGVGVSGDVVSLKKKRKVVEDEPLESDMARRTKSRTIASETPTNPLIASATSSTKVKVRSGKEMAKERNSAKDPCAEKRKETKRVALKGSSDMFGVTSRDADEDDEFDEGPEEEENLRNRDESRTLTPEEVRAILGDEDECLGASNWVRRSARMPSRAALMDPNTQVLLQQLPENGPDMVVLKMKKYVADPSAPCVVIDAVLDALEQNSNCQSLYIQNYNEGMQDRQVLRLLGILQLPRCNIWCLNIGETYKVKTKTWKKFARGLKHTKITHMYASEHTISPELKEYIRETIRKNRSKHYMHIDPKNLDTIVKCTHCWWNPINAKVLRPYLHAGGYGNILNDKEKQGARGTISAAEQLI